MKYGKISLVLAFILVLSMFSFAFVPSVSAYTITVDGNPNDWLADASAQPVNTGKWYWGVGPLPYSGEYVWKDDLGDDMGNGSYLYPATGGYTGVEADLKELRITWDANYLYLLIRIAGNMHNGTAIGIGIDQDHVAGSGLWWAPPSFSDAVYLDGSTIYPEYEVIVGPIKKVMDWTWTDVCVPPDLLVANDTAYDTVFEVGVPLSVIGDPSGKDWVFSCFTCVTNMHQEWEGYGNSGEVFAGDPATNGHPNNPGGGIDDWVDPDIFDMAFYPDKATQEAELNDYLPGWPNMARIGKRGGYADVAFANQMGEIFVIPGQHSGLLTPPVHTPCTEHVINATELGLDIGDTFVAQIYINNVTGLWTWGCDLYWDPNVLDLLSWTENWTWFGNPPPTPGIGFTATIDHVAGTATGAGWALTDPNPPISGSGPIVNLRFQVKNWTGWFGFPDPSIIRIVCLVALSDYDGYDIYLKEHNALFTKVPPEPYGPTAGIGQSPKPYYVGDPITLWSTSTGGWRPFEVVHLKNCTWTIKFENGDLVPGSWLNTSLNPVVIECQTYPGCPITFTPLEADNYTIILEVRTKPDATLDGLGRNYDMTTKIKEAIKKVPVFIDCFTNKARRCGYDAYAVGFGDDLPADAFTFDELVTLYAWVVYKNNPMQGRLVSFEVYSPVGLFVLKQNMTDANGVAFIKFRIPIPCGDPEMYEGKWWCFQKVRLCDEYYNDTLEFDVGWIVEIDSVVVPDTVDMTKPFDITITLKNIAMASRFVLVSVEIDDDNLVPVVSINYTKRIPGGEFCRPEYEPDKITVQLPKWTYPGTGIVWVNAFSGWPTECGHCWCPPAKAVFVITCPPPEKPDP